MRTRWMLGGVIMLLLSGCSTETIYLRNQVGTTVKCGPYTYGVAVGTFRYQARRDLRRCVDDYESRGYERIPASE